MGVEKMIIEFRGSMVSVDVQNESINIKASFDLSLSFIDGLKTHLREVKEFNFIDVVNYRLTINEKGDTGL